MPQARVIFINRFYWPDQPATGQLLTDLAEALVRRGLLVTVLTTGSAGAAARESHEGVDIVRVSIRSAGQPNLRGKLFSFIGFIHHTRRWLAREVKSSDVVVTMTDPPLLGAALDGIARRRGARHVHWIQDIFPEVAAAVFGNRLPNIFRPWRDRAWRRASACVAPGNAMAELIRSRGVDSQKVAVIQNWSPAGIRPSADSALAWRRKLNLEDKFVVMYSGNLGRVHDFTAIVPIARELSKNSRIVFVFIGQGAGHAQLAAEVGAAGLTNVRFMPPVDRSELSAALSGGDLHLVTLRAGCEALVFPSKLYGIAAVGRPALVIGPRQSEPSQMVEDSHWGAAFSPADVSAMAGFIRRLENDSNECAGLNAAAIAFALKGGIASAEEAWLRQLYPWVSPSEGLEVNPLPLPPRSTGALPTSTS